MTNNSINKFFNKKRNKRNLEKRNKEKKKSLGGLAPS
jgi:hypothetical protein